MNSNSVDYDGKEEEWILDTLLQRLDDDYLNCMFREPILNASKVFSYDHQPILNQRDLIHFAAQYLCHLSNHCVEIVPPWTELEAKKKSVFYLNNFQSNGLKGFEQALLVAKNPWQNGTQLVLEQITGLLISQLIQDYRHFLYYSLIDPADKKQKKRLIQLIFQKFQTVLPSTILEKPPEMFVENIISIIDQILRCESEINQTINSF